MTEHKSDKIGNGKTKCPLCKRRKFTEEDIEYIQFTGRCKKCDIRIMRVELRNREQDSFEKKYGNKHPTDISKHEHDKYCECDKCNFGEDTNSELKEVMQKDYGGKK